MMLPLGPSTSEIFLSEESWQQQGVGQPSLRSTVDVAKLLPILGVVENHLRRLVQKPNCSGVNPVFRSMSGLYRYAAQRGMDDFCDLAYEVAQAFDPGKHSDSKMTQRISLLALVAVGQMRRLLSSPISEQNRLDPKFLELKRCQAQEIIVALLTKF